MVALTALVLSACAPTVKVPDTNGGTADTGTWVATIEGPWTQVDEGYGNVCAVGDGGAVTCWSIDPPPTDVAFSSVSVTDFGACGVTVDGGLACWGGLEDHAPDLNDLVEVAVSPWSGCGRGIDGTLSCWSEYELPVVDSPEGVFSDVDIDDWYGCAVDASGEIACWGEWTVGVDLADPPDGTFSTVHVGVYWNAGAGDDGAVAWNNHGEEVRIDGPVDALALPEYVYDNGGGCYLSSGALTCFDLDREGDFYSFTRLSDALTGTDYVAVEVGAHSAYVIDAAGDLHVAGRGRESSRF